MLEAAVYQLGVRTQSRRRRQLLFGMVSEMLSCRSIDCRLVDWIVAGLVACKYLVLEGGLSSSVRILGRLSTRTSV